MDECFVFGNLGYNRDNDCAALLKEHYKGSARWLLLNDCCHSGTIWDIPTDMKKATKDFPPNIMSMSAARDVQTAKQSSGLFESDNLEGVFTCYFLKSLRENQGISAREIEPFVNAGMRDFCSELVTCPTRNGLLDEPRSAFPAECIKPQSSFTNLTVYFSSSPCNEYIVSAAPLSAVGVRVVRGGI